MLQVRREKESWRPDYGLLEKNTEENAEDNTEETLKKSGVGTQEIVKEVMSRETGGGHKKGKCGMIFFYPAPATPALKGKMLLGF